MLSTGVIMKKKNKKKPNVNKEALDLLSKLKNKIKTITAELEHNYKHCMERDE